MTNFAQCLETFNQIENLNFIIEDAEKDIVTLESIQSIVNKKTNVSTEFNKIIDISVESICVRLGVKNNHSNVKIATEDFTSFIKRIWAAIVKAFKKALDFIKKLFGFSSNTVDESNDTLNKNKDKNQYDDIKFTIVKPNLNFDDPKFKKDIGDILIENKSSKVFSSNGFDAEKDGDSYILKSHIPTEHPTLITNQRFLDIFYYNQKLNTNSNDLINKVINNYNSLLITLLGVKNHINDILYSAEGILTNCLDEIKASNKYYNSNDKHHISNKNIDDSSFPGRLTGLINDIKKLFSDDNFRSQRIFKNIKTTSYFNTEITDKIYNISFINETETSPVNKTEQISIKLTDLKSHIPILLKLGNNIKSVADLNTVAKINNYIDNINENLISKFTPEYEKLLNDDFKLILNTIKKVTVELQRYLTEYYTHIIKEAVEVHYTMAQVIGKTHMKTESWAKRKGSPF